MIHTIETLKELHDQRFCAMDKAILLVAEEMSRRLENLNHAHEQAREKERDFVGREAFETFTQRVAEDFTTLRREGQTAGAFREASVKDMNDEVAGQAMKNEMRFGKIEGVHARIIGGLALGAVILPLITGMIVYLLTKSQ
jgi:hypothetical protein